MDKSDRKSYRTARKSWSNKPLKNGKLASQSHRLMEIANITMNNLIANFKTVQNSTRDSLMEVFIMLQTWYFWEKEKKKSKQKEEHFSNFHSIKFKDIKISPRLRYSALHTANISSGSIEIFSFFSWKKYA